MPEMRTTLTIDDDLMARLKDEARRRSVPFRDVVNDALRRALTRSGKKKKPAPRTYPSRLKAGFDPTGFNKLADDLEAEVVATKLLRSR
jgi:hypothetical protein